MPSIIRSLPTPRQSHETMPGTIVDLGPSDKTRRASNARHSLDFSIRSSRSSKSSQESLVPASSGSLEVEIESPPLVCYGPPDQSSGALLSGQLWLNISTCDVELESLKMGFQTVVTTKRPVVINCPECTSKTTDLQTWEFISGAHPVSQGDHSYPFSYLVPGHLPATTDSALGTIKYQLYGRAVTTRGELLRFTRDIKVTRSIFEGADRNSLRIFPPTNLSANLTLPSVIHRGGTFPIEMRLDGIVTKSNMTRWKLRKLTWRIEEKAKIISPACEQHAAKIGGVGKGVQYEDVKTLAGDEIKSGWKTDFETGDGRVEYHFDAGIPAGIIATDDVDNTSGLTVSHNFVIELIVAEEYVPKNTKMITPTGCARVLRMQFNMNTTARSGMGISWDDECPPRYDDVSSSPPLYQYDSESSEEFSMI